MTDPIKISVISIGLNVLLGIFKIVVGIIGRSGALIADGIHSFSDFVSDIVDSKLGNLVYNRIITLRDSWAKTAQTALQPTAEMNTVKDVMERQCLSSMCLVLKECYMDLIKFLRSKNVAVI